MNRIKSYNQFLNENLKYPSLYEDETEKLFAKSSDTATIKKLTDINKKELQEAFKLLQNDPNIFEHIWDICGEYIVNPIANIPSQAVSVLGFVGQVVVDPGGTASKTITNMYNGVTGSNAKSPLTTKTTNIANKVGGVTNTVANALSVDVGKVDLKPLKLSDLSAEDKKGMIAGMMGNPVMGEMLRFLDDPNLKLPINSKFAQTGREEILASLPKYLQTIKKDIESNAFDTGTISMYGMGDYFNFNMDRTAFGISQSYVLLMKCISGELPDKTWWGRNSSYLYAFLIAGLLAYATISNAETIRQWGHKQWNEWGKSVGDWTHKQTGTIVEGREDFNKFMGKFHKTTAGAIVGVLGTLGAIENFKNTADRINDNNEKYKFNMLGVGSFVPYLKSLPYVNLTLESTRTIVNTFVNDINTHEEIKKRIREQINSADGKQSEIYSKIVDDFNEKFPATVRSIFDANVQYVVKSALGNSYPIPEVAKKFIDVDYTRLTADVIKGSKELNMGWFGDYKDVNAPIQDIGMSIEDMIGFEDYVDKRNPMVMLCGSLIYLAVIESITKFPEVLFITNLLPEGKITLPEPIKRVVNSNIFGSELELVGNRKLEIIPIPWTSIENKFKGMETSDLVCGMYITIKDKDGKILKCKFGDVFFKTNEAVLSGEANFVQRFEKLAKGYKGLNALIVGNADVSGGEGVEDGIRGNIPLSKRRADAIKKALSMSPYLKNLKEFDFSDGKDTNILTSGAGSEYARAYTQYYNKKKGTKKIIEIESSSKSDAQRIKDELANDRRIEIFITTDNDELWDSSADKSFIEEYCKLEPNIESDELFLESPDVIVVNSKSLPNFTNFASFRRKDDGSKEVPVDKKPNKQIEKDMMAPEENEEPIQDSYIYNPRGRYNILNEAKSCKSKVVKFLEGNDCSVDYTAGTCKVGTKTMKIEKALIKYKAPESLIKSYVGECEKEVNEALRLRRRKDWSWIR